MPTVSGSNLKSWSGDREWIFDPTNPIPTSAGGHVVTLTSAGGFTAGRYAMRDSSSFNLGGADGTQNIVRLYDTTGTLVTWGAGTTGGGVWSYWAGTTGGGGTSGTNLVSDYQYGDGGYVNDPDSPMSDAVIGRTITVSGGTGFTAGDYCVVSKDLGLYKLVSRADNTTLVTTTRSSDGATWSVTGGMAIPSARTPNTTFTGAIKIVVAGDSISNFATTELGTALATAYPNAASVNVYNGAVSGTGSAGFLPGTSLYNGVVSLVNTNGATIIQYQVGVNDAQAAVATSASAYLANLQATVAGWFADCPTLQKVVLHAPTWVWPNAFTSGGGAGTWPADPNTLIASYGAQLASVGNGSVVGTTQTYDFFDADRGLLTDGVHPNSYGQTGMVNLWVSSLATTIEGPTNSAPNTPTLSAGTPTATTVTLTGSAFSDPDAGDTHAASQWQVDDDSAFGSPLISTGDDTTNKTSYTATGLPSSTTLYARVRYKDSAGNYSNWSTAATFTTAAADTTPPTLTSPFGDPAVGTLANLYVDTDDGSGTLYAVASQSNTPPSKPQIKAGQDSTGAAADFAHSQAVTAPGTQTVNASGLTPGRWYYAYFLQRDPAGNDSAVVASPAFSTDFTPPTPGTPVVSTDGLSIDVPFTEADTPPLVVYNDPAQYTVKADGVTKAVASVTHPAGTTVRLNFSAAILAGQVVTLAYAQGGGALTDTAGNLVDPFGPVAVTNNSTATAAAPEIDVQIPAGSSRASGYTDDLGTVAQGSTQDVTVTITNTGTATLTLSYGVSGGLSVQSAGPASIAAGGTGTLTVRLSTASTGAASGTLTITSNDADEGTYTVNFTATVTDQAPPVISAVSSGTPGQTSATITWTTDEAADSQVEYGTTAGYGSSTTLDVSMVTSHSVVLSGLTAGTVYHYRVKSRDAAGNLATGTDHTFTTVAVVAPSDTYSADADLDNAYGRDNVAAWADLNDNGDADEIAARKAWARGVAKRWIDSKLRGARLTAPATADNFSEYDLLADVEAERAGAILYFSRGVSDRQGQAGDMDGAMQGHFDHAERELDRLIGVVTANDNDDQSVAPGEFVSVPLKIEPWCTGGENESCW